MKSVGEQDHTRGLAVQSVLLCGLAETSEFLFALIQPESRPIDADWVEPARLGHWVAYHVGSTVLSVRG